MCQYCDDRGLPGLMCGRACMEYQMDRKRCRGCASAHRPPDVWPVFQYCPYCGRDLNEAQNKNNEKEKMEMARLIWTSEMDETVRQMDADGKSDAEICEALGIEKLQLKNRRYNLMYAERKNGATESPETEGIRDELEAGQRDLTPDESERFGCKTEPVKLSSAEQEMARMIEERERMIRVKEAELEKARREARWLQDELDEKNVQNEKLGQKLAAKDRIIAKMAAEIYGEA